MNDTDVQLKTTGQKIRFIRIAFAFASIFVSLATNGGSHSSDNDNGGRNTDSAIKIECLCITYICILYSSIKLWTLNDRVGSANNCSNHHYKSWNKCKNDKKIGLMVFPLLFFQSTFIHSSNVSISIAIDEVKIAHLSISKQTVIISTALLISKAIFELLLIYWLNSKN